MIVNYIIRRVLISLPILLLVVTLVFLAFQIIPGDPARLYVGEQATLETIEHTRIEMGLDRPLYVQYFDYIIKLLQGDMGKSFTTKQPVIVMITPRFIETGKLAFASIVLSAFVGVGMGVFSAINRGRFIELFVSIFTVFGISIPVFWLALLMMYVFGLKLSLLPLAGNETPQHYIMPAVCMAMYSIALITRMTRSSILEIINSDFVRTARAKGLREAQVMWKHVVMNALIPIITIVGLRFGYLFGGAIITETIFAWPGMGRLLFTAVNQRDIPVVQGCLLMFAVTFVFINLVVDLLYAVVDPRIRLSQ
jgi:glutathione transport system permease protein